MVRESRINLIKKTSKYTNLKKISYFIKLFLLSALVVVFIAYGASFVYRGVAEERLAQVTNQIPQQLAQGAQASDTFTKTTYGYEKLKVIREIFLGSPEYYKQYELLVELITQNENLAIDDFTIDKESSVSLTISSSEVNDLFSFVEGLNTEENKKNFEIIELNAITLVRSVERNAPEGEQALYTLSLKLQFLEEFNEPDI